MLQGNLNSCWAVKDYLPSHLTLHANDWNIRNSLAFFFFFGFFGFIYLFFFSIIPEIRGIPNQLHPPVPVQGNIWSSCLDLSVINLTSASKDVHVCTNSCCWVEVSPLGWFTLQSTTQTSQENHHSLTNILIALSRVIVISGKFLGVGWQRSHKVVNQLVETLNAEFSGQTQCKVAKEFCNQKGYRVSYIYTP